MREWKSRVPRGDGGMTEGKRENHPSNGKATPPPSLLDPIEPNPKPLPPHRDPQSPAKLQPPPCTLANPCPPAPPMSTMTLSTPPNQTQVRPRCPNGFFLLHPRRRPHRPLVQETLSSSSITVAFQSPLRHRRKAQRRRTGI